MARGSAEAAGPETGSERGGWAGKVVFQAPVGEGRQERPLRSLHGLWVRGEGVLPGTWQDVSVALEISVIAENRITFLMTLRNSC